MNDDALRELARQAYDKEYQEKTPMGRAETAIGMTGMGLMGAGFWAMVGGVGAIAFGVAAAPAILMGGLFAFGFGWAGMLVSATIGGARAEKALQRDLDNGMLAARFKEEVLKPAASPAAQPGQALAVADAGAAFAAASAASGNDNSAPAAKASLPKAPSL